MGVLNQTKIALEYSETRNHLNIQNICEKLWQDICHSTNKWVDHTCNTPGCKEGYITVDGNEYLKRSKCALPKEKVRIQRDLPTIYRCCTNSPVPGGKSQKPSKFCAAHQVNDNNASHIVSVPTEFFSAATEKTLLPEDTIPLHSCKKKENISLFFETTSGMLALVRPCGIVVSMTEMFTSESLTQVFLFILRTFTKTPEQFLRLRYLGYDRACALEPFLKNQKKNGSAGAKLLLEHVKFLVDIFHVAKHTEEACMPPTNPNCWYHPRLNRFEEIHGANTESCEQGFKRLNIYFNLTRKMTQFKRNILFWHVNECFNANLEDELRAKGLM